MTTATTRIVLALAISALAGLLILPLARSVEPRPTPARVQKCTGVMAPGSSC